MPNRSQSSPERSKRAPPCCRCNGINARCKFCASPCAKAGRACTCCLPAKHGNGATFSHYSASSTAMVLSNPLPGATTRPPDTQQLPPSQPIIQQLQASIETVAPSSSSEHPSSLSSPSASCCPQNMQQSLIDVTLGNESAVSLKALFLFPVPITIATLPGAGVTIGHLLQCHSSGARCTACKCCREEHPCVNCYPRVEGEIVLMLLPQTSLFHPLLLFNHCFL